jgi:hypothetical protein
MAKYMIELQWKEHSVDLEALEIWMKANAGASYDGNSADSKLTLYFLEEPSQDIKDAIIAEWEAMDDAGHEKCVSHRSLAQRSEAAQVRAAAIKAKKMGMLQKTWANMDGIERKIYLGLESEILDEDLE